MLAPQQSHAATGQTARQGRPLGRDPGRRGGHRQRDGHRGVDRRHDAAAVSPARVRSIAERRCRRRIAAEDVARRGRRDGRGREEAAGRPSARPRRDGHVSRSAQRGDLAAESAAEPPGRTGPRADGKSAPRSTVGPGEPTRWSGPTARSRWWKSACEAAAGAGAQRASPSAPSAPGPTIPPEKGQLPLRAVVRAPKDKEGVVTCAAAAGGQPHPAGPPGPRGKPGRRGDDEDRRGQSSPARDRRRPSARWPWTARERPSTPAPSDGVPALVAAGRRRPGRASRK